jgi:hypothetical protein
MNGTKIDLARIKQWVSVKYPTQQTFKPHENCLSETISDAVH